LSCDTGERRGALAAVRNGVAALAGKKAFYLGLTLAGTTLGGGLWLARRRPGPPPVSPAVAPPLPGQEWVAPLRPDQRGGRPCAGCRVVSKPGPWYDLCSRVYCKVGYF
jgi:hypothetical protein